MVTGLRPGCLYKYDEPICDWTDTIAKKIFATKPNPVMQLGCHLHNNSKVVLNWVPPIEPTCFNFYRLDIGSNVTFMLNRTSTNLTFYIEPGRSYNISLYAFSKKFIPLHDTISDPKICQIKSEPSLHDQLPPNTIGIEPGEKYEIPVKSMNGEIAPSRTKITVSMSHETSDPDEIDDKFFESEPSVYDFSSIKSVIDIEANIVVNNVSTTSRSVEDEEMVTSKMAFVSIGLILLVVISK